MTITEEQAKKLRDPFPAEQIGKLPRVTCRACREASSRVCSDHSKQKCEACGMYGTTAHIHLDYVGHAATTDRLLEVDPGWTWEPMGFDSDGTPAINVANGMATMWARITVCGVTRPCVGSTEAGKSEAAKELISDLIRNGAMRFGVALDLWSKEDLHGETDTTPAGYSQSAVRRDQGPYADPEGQRTQAGNTRRGPAVLAGWVDVKDQREGHEALTAATEHLTDEQRETLRAWRAEQGYESWPMPHDEFTATMTKIGELAEEPF